MGKEYGMAGSSQEKVTGQESRARIGTDGLEEGED
jgi:hypothetical protein